MYTHICIKQEAGAALIRTRDHNMRDYSFTRLDYGPFCIYKCKYIRNFFLSSAERKGFEPSDLK